MSQLVDHLAELTGFRDRDVLDVTLVGALRDLLRPQEVAIYRAVGEPGSQFWMTRARLRAYQERGLDGSPSLAMRCSRSR